MRAAASIRVLFLPVLGLLAIARPAAADSNLLENSPFLPPNVTGTAGGAAAPLELRSILKDGSDFEFSLYDTAKRQSTWVKLNETGHDFVVKAYDPANESVTVEQQNRTYKLALKEVKIVPLAVVAVPNANQLPVPGGPGQMVLPGGPRGGPLPMVPGGIRGPGPTAQPQAPALTPEQLRNLEADINRRRELRRQAAASFSQPAQAPPATPQQP